MFISAMIFTRLDERRAHLGRQLDDVLERAVDAEPDPHAILGRLDVHVGGAVAQRLGDDLVDDLDDRGVRVDGRLGRLDAARARTSLARNASMSRGDVPKARDTSG